MYVFVLNVSGIYACVYPVRSLLILHNKSPNKSDRGVAFADLNSTWAVKKTPGCSSPKCQPRINLPPINAPISRRSIKTFTPQTSCQKCVQIPIPGIALGRNSFRTCKRLQVQRRPKWCRSSLVRWIWNSLLPWKHPGCLCGGVLNWALNDGNPPVFVMFVYRGDMYTKPRKCKVGPAFHLMAFVDHGNLRVTIELFANHFAASYSGVSKSHSQLPWQTKK